MRTSNFSLIFLVSLILFFNADSFAMTLPKPIQEYLQTAKIGEDNSLPSRGEGLKLFNDYLKQNWRTVLDNIETVAPTDSDKRKIVLGCESLNDEDYLAFLIKTQELFAQGRININVVETVLNPSQARQGFIAANSENPAIRTLMEKYRGLIPANHYLKAYPDEVLSGKSKQKLDEMNRENGTSGPEPMPIGNVAQNEKGTVLASPSNTPATPPTPSLPTATPAKTDQPAAKEEPSSNSGWLYALGAAVLTGLGYVWHRTRKR